MAKTAEEDRINPIIEKMMNDPMDSGECLRLFNQFAAQEVEAYRERLRAALDSEYPGEYPAVNRFKSIIDAVK